MAPANLGLLCLALLAPRAAALSTQVARPKCPVDKDYAAYDWGLAEHPQPISGCHVLQRVRGGQHNVDTTKASAQQLAMCGRSANAPATIVEIGTRDEPGSVWPASTACGCCTAGYGTACGLGSCLCPDDSHPVQSVLAAAKQGARGQLFTAEEGLEMIRNRNIMFIGDASTRRLMWGLCAFLNGRPFQDRFHERDHAHGDMRCPNWDPADGPEGGAMTNNNAVLEFLWAPTPREWLPKMAMRMEERWDFIVLNIYHWERLHRPERTSSDLVTVWEHWLNWPSRHMKPPILLMSPNLVANNAGVNAEILRYTGVMKQAQLENHTLFSDSSNWMRASPDSLERHPCLTADRDDPTGIHINNNFGQALHVQHLLATMSGVLNYSRLDTWGNRARHKWLSWQHRR